MANSIFDSEIQPRLNAAAEELGKRHARGMRVEGFGNEEFLDELISLAGIRKTAFMRQIIWDNIDMVEVRRHFESAL